MISIVDGSVHIQTSSEAQVATPCWLGEVALMASRLQKQGILNKIGERVRFARRRFGCYEVIDFLAVLFGYAISGEQPWKRSIHAGSTSPAATVAPPLRSRLHGMQTRGSRSHTHHRLANAHPSMGLQLWQSW